MRLSPLVAAAALVVLAVPPAARADEREAEAREHFNTGMRHFRAQEFKEAAVAFEKFLELKPDSDLVLALENEAGLRAFQEMLLQQGGLKEIALRILKAAEASRRKVSADPSMIASLVSEIEQVRTADSGPNFAAYVDAKERLVRIGAQAAPALIDRLVDETHYKLRAGVHRTLVEMRDEAVLPLLAALADARTLMRQNVCMILGQIGDRRAVAALKARWEDPRELAEVKAAAAESLRKITGQDAAALPRAVACFHRLAEDYHNGNPDIVRSATLAERTVWHFDAAQGRVLGRPVPGYAYPDYLAEQACYAALQVDPQYAPILPTLICVTFAQMGEVETLLAIATERLVAGEGEAAEVEALKARREALAKGRALALASGRGPLHAALRRAMDHGEIPVAMACCDALKEVDDGSWLPRHPRIVPLTEAHARARYFPDAR